MYNGTAQHSGESSEVQSTSQIANPRQPLPHFVHYNHGARTAAINEAKTYVGYLCTNPPNAHPKEKQPCAALNT